MDLSTYISTCVFIILLQGLQVSEGQDDLWDKSEDEFDWNNPTPKELLPPKFRDTPDQVEVRQGETAVLRCEIDNLGTKKVTWRKSTELTPMFIQTKSFSSDKRYRVEHEPLQPHFNMIIEQAKKSDEGLYVCQVSSRDPLHHYVHLKVKKRYVSNTGGSRKISGRSHSSQDEIKPDFQFSKDQILDKGDKLSLYCSEVTGKKDMADSIDWFFNGERLTSDYSKELVIKKQIAMMKRNISSTLEIESVEMSDAGTYVCRTSTNRIGRVRVDVLNADSKNSKRGTEKNSSQGKYAIANPRHNRYDDEEHEDPEKENGCSRLLFRPATLSFVIFAACLLHRFLMS